ncbi:mitochondrial 39-S ribosomal protein L47 (MRP-L47)-domain-containing protein [Ampelomyces quisqualis]|uniref:Large ribosomal subunit protein uL29m n=1 Tax=Ampelomyces quisqualis TaxID=50730 RepID=A0A6A5QFD3_AMPQU|nr:mitochondrial 39-S ribosomal protein L47 (MRP-L47)-domain-containing protein [Ampelomyces quisqualis]
MHNYGHVSQKRTDYQLSKRSRCMLGHFSPAPAEAQSSNTMATMHSRILRPTLAAAKAPDPLPAFLASSTQCPRKAPAARFSTSPVRCKADNNKNRGLSAVRATGLRDRQTLSVGKAPRAIPRPVPIAQKATGTPDHGLWGFFKDQQLLQTPLEESRHGRAWTIAELRNRTFDTLHQLWWICAKERNRLATDKIERQRLEAGYGDVEGKERDETIQKTMKAILDTLAERQLAWKEAQELAKHDPNIDLKRTDGPQFLEPAYEDEPVEQEAEETHQEPTNRPLQ